MLLIQVLVCVDLALFVVLAIIVAFSLALFVVFGHYCGSVASACACACCYVLASFCLLWPKLINICFFVAFKMQGTNSGISCVFSKND
jgi:hypothetical protein